jgi:hypothetical protein
MSDTTARDPACDMRFMRKRRLVSRAQHEDPMASMANLFDLMLLLAVGLFIMALSSYGLGGLLTQKNFSLVTNPGTKNEKIIIKNGANIQKLTQTKNSVTGVGVPVGTLYKLTDGSVVYVPGPTQ